MMNRYGAGDTGCVVDGVLGVYAGEVLCQYAASCGWEPWCEWHPDSLDRDWLEDSALEFLNDRVAERGYSFGWFEGNVMYWSDSDWEDC